VYQLSGGVRDGRREFGLGAKLEANLDSRAGSLDVPNCSDTKRLVKENTIEAFPRRCLEIVEICHVVILVVVLLEGIHHLVSYLRGVGTRQTRNMTTWPQLGPADRRSKPSTYRTEPQKSQDCYRING
jgi:hypothetical protein